jgi:hypothetical protein
VSSVDKIKERPGPEDITPHLPSRDSLFINPEEGAKTNDVNAHNKHRLKNP